MLLLVEGFDRPDAMEKKLRLCRTKGLPNPTYYAEALQGEYADWAFCEERSIQQKGRWREQIFGVEESTALDFEIGTGNGYHFAQYAQDNPKRCFVGAEWKYKPLIQSIRRALNAGAQNARILRYDAALVDHLFAENELNNVIIHHPDPWPKKKQKKNRLINSVFLKNIYRLQREASLLEFKTDNRDYFDWAVDFFKASDYRINGVTYDLHSSEYASKNFVTHFEKIFLAKGQPIHMIFLSKD